MNLLFIFTGGTIASTKQEGLVRIDPFKKGMLLEAYREKYPEENDITYHEWKPCYMHSENHDGESIRLVAESVVQAVTAKEGYDGVIVFHGTDTLAYTAAACAYVVGNSCRPVVFVSANFPLEDPRSNGLDNFHGAVCFLRQSVQERKRGKGEHTEGKCQEYELLEGEQQEAGCQECGLLEDGHQEARQSKEENYKGVFVSYRNGGEPCRIYRATRIQAYRPFSDVLRSTFGSFVGTITEKSGRSGDSGCGFSIFHPNKSSSFEELPDEIAPLSIEGMSAQSPVLRLPCYPGMVYPDSAALKKQGIRAVLMDSYHSGTINTKSKASCRFYQDMFQIGIPLYVAGINGEAAYESTEKFARYGIHPLLRLAPVAAYMKLWLGISSGLSPEEFLEKPLAGDRFTINDRAGH